MRKKIGVVESWSDGVTEEWSNGVLEYWGVGGPEPITPPLHYSITPIDHAM
jgi:hypothetical protein